MEQLLHHSLLLFMSFCFSCFHGLTSITVIAFLLSIALSCYSYAFQKRRSFYIFYFLYICLSFWKIEFLFYTPILFYSYLNKEFIQHYGTSFLLIILPLLFNFSKDAFLFLSIILVEDILAFFLKQRYLSNERLKQDFIRQRDNTKELALLLSEQNQNMLVRQEQDIRIATLDERNRIAREIHDNVGHLLSSALLQIGALQAIHSQTELQEPLQNLRTTISTGMDSVRNSVHNLHDDSLNLETALQKVIKQFTFCPISLEYIISEEPKQSLIYQILPIVKEALNNTIRHSNASKVLLTFREQATFYQFIIVDNGALKPIQTSGIGLKNIKERVYSMHGYINIDNQEGFRLFITIPKEDEYENHNR